MGVRSELPKNRITYSPWRIDKNMKLIVNLSLAFLLSACASAPPQTLTERQQVGSVSFQSVENYQIDEDETGGVYISSPDGEIGVIMQVAPTSTFLPEMTPTVLGGEYPEEGFPVAMMLFLGFENISLAQLKTFELGEYTGFSRTFVATNLSDKIEGEYVFFPFGDQTFIAMGSVISATGNNQWNPQGKAVFDAIVDSVQFP